MQYKSIALHEKCPYSELFWSAFSRIWTEYREILRKNADQNNSEYEHFLRSVDWLVLYVCKIFLAWINRKYLKHVVFLHKSFYSCHYRIYWTYKIIYTCQ